MTRGQVSKVVSIAAAFNDDVTGRQTYADVPSSHPFWLWIERLSLHAVMGGYNCGGPGEPCDDQQRPYFRPGADITRGQLSKIASNAAGFNDTPTGQTFEDVPATNPLLAVYRAFIGPWCDRRLHVRRSGRAVWCRQISHTSAQATM